MLCFQIITRGKPVVVHIFFILFIFQSSFSWFPRITEGFQFKANYVIVSLKAKYNQSSIWSCLTRNKTSESCFYLIAALVSQK